MQGLTEDVVLWGVAVLLTLAVFLLGFIAGRASKMIKIHEGYEETINGYEELVEQNIKTINGYKNLVRSYEKALGGRKCKD